MEVRIEPNIISGRLSLAEIFEIRRTLGRRERKSDIALLRACHARLHGAECPADCAHRDGRVKTAAYQAAFGHKLRPHRQVLEVRGDARDEAFRQRTYMQVDFVAGTFDVEEDGSLPSVKAVRMRLSGEVPARLVGSAKGGAFSGKGRAASPVVVAPAVTVQLCAAHGRVAIKLLWSRRLSAGHAGRPQRQAPLARAQSRSLSRRSPRPSAAKRSAC